MSPAQPGGFHIFICYRREGTGGHAGRLYDLLLAGLDDQPGFASEQIFIDVDTLQPGEDFREAIRSHVATCDVLLAVIGKQWAKAREGKRGRRLDNPSDYVRLEIEAALERKIPLVPVLVDGAVMPDESDLPESISALAYRQAVSLSHTSFRDDVGRLLASLKNREKAKADQGAKTRTPQQKRRTAAPKAGSSTSRRPSRRKGAPEAAGTPAQMPRRHPSPSKDESTAEKLVAPTEGAPMTDLEVAAAERALPDEDLQWLEEDDHHVGEVLEGRVVSIKEHYALVFLDSGVTGMLPGKRGGTSFLFQTSDGHELRTLQRVRVRVEAIDGSTTSLSFITTLQSGLRQKP